MSTNSQTAGNNLSSFLQVKVATLNFLVQVSTYIFNTKLTVLVISDYIQSRVYSFIYLVTCYKPAWSMVIFPSEVIQVFRTT